MNIFSQIRRWIEIPFRFRTLFWGFVTNEISGRFAGSMGGLAWSIITPLATLLIYIFVFSVIFQIRMKPVETGTDSFVVFFLTGMLPWAAFAEAMGNATDVFLMRANLITKVAFPLEVLPLSGVAAPFILHGLGFSMFMIYLAFNGYAHTGWLWLPLVVLAHMVFTLGLVILVGGLCVFVRDIKQFMNIALSLWFFLSPILYPLSMVPEGFRWLIQYNPMSPFIRLYQQVLIQQGMCWDVLGCALGLSMISFVAGILFFGRSRHAFADVL